MKSSFLERIFKINREIAQQETLDQVFSALANIASRESDSERSSIFLHDNHSNELYTRFAQGLKKREIRIFDNEGIAGHVFQTGKGVIIDDVYCDPHFNRKIDRKSEFVTRNMLCVPMLSAKGEVIGIVQSINKKQGEYQSQDLKTLQIISDQVAIIVQSFQMIEHLNESRTKELEFLNVVADTTSELELGPLLNKVMTQATHMLNAERSTLFLNDEKNNELWSLVGQGLDSVEIRFPNHLGIAGTVFTSAKSINIPYAYADLRFNPAFDKQTGFFTRSILCIPVINKTGKVIGVTQVLNKKDGVFNEEDESRLKAFTAQISIGLENASLFDDVQKIKNYNESMLESMSNGVLTFNEDGMATTCNAASLKILNCMESDIIKRDAHAIFGHQNLWLIDLINKNKHEEHGTHLVDVELTLEQESKYLNVTIQTLKDHDKNNIGSILLMEDISNEKRVKSTMSRYIDAHLIDQLMEDGSDILGGQSVEATVLFSDIRGFTNLSEELGAQGIVNLLNEYFTLMVDIIVAHGGMLDKFIGDAIMAAYGVPIAHGDDADQGVISAIEMMQELKQLNNSRQKQNLSPIDIGVGINSDFVISGNIGSPKRMDFTVIGDGVNLASRLESACKQYSANIIISDNTKKRLKGTYRIRELDCVVVKGQTKPVKIYEVLDHHDEETFPNVMEVVAYFHDGLKKYKKQKFSAAISAFNQALLLHQDPVTSMYIDRCEHFIAHAPAPDWDGVFKMQSK
ncbi:GAF domain-containing protein [Pseudoalteromonas denitrificans]|uniref:Adenylate cyclase n=1 Tax=Pseudoalteromonas denitrificans DSM 6059 TaxID=1123010 RepID=A0A1I1GSV2_9GAMM|nr:GAF domain-containing protein [Pseudoalteromonas denitrificans]SFC12948.1 adenylate cyclase [Pseudoalteromonas denitrificans DSM 6059]